MILPWSVAPIALAATIFLIISDIDLIWKVLAGGLFAASVVLRTVPFFDEHVPFYVPVGIDLILAVWGILYWRS